VTILGKVVTNVSRGTIFVSLATSWLLVSTKLVVDVFSFIILSPLYHLLFLPLLRLILHLEAFLAIDINPLVFGGPVRVLGAEGSCSLLAIPRWDLDFFAVDHFTFP